MKRTSCVMFLCAAMSFPLKTRAEKSSDPEQFTILLEPKWEDLEKNKKRKLFTDKWILAGDITFKKRAPDFVSLNELHLTWNGKKINHIIGSLYEKTKGVHLMPIEKYLICDGSWKSSEQKLILKFEKPRTLYAVNTLSLVLTIPKEMEKVLQDGYFSLEVETLPDQFKNYATENDLSLVMKETPARN